jgi:hypothetical protein
MLSQKDFFTKNVVIVIITSLTRKDLIAIDTPLDPELRGEEFKGFRLLPRFDLPADESELRDGRGLEVLLRLEGHRLDGVGDRTVTSSPMTFLFGRNLCSEQNKCIFTEFGNLNSLKLNAKP